VFLTPNHLWNFIRRGDNRKLAFNFANYGFYQGVNYLIPLVTIPYIVRIIGVSYFGVLSFAQAVIYYLMIVVEYGFSYTGVQLIAQNKSPQKQSEAISAIFLIQFGIALIGLLSLGIGLIIFQDIRNYRLVYLFTFLTIPAQILQAIWFYIGAEEMQFLNLINLTSRLLYIISIFILVKQQTHYVLIPLINAGAMLVAGIVSLSFIVRKFKIRFQLVSLQIIIMYLKDGWHLFVSIFSMNFYRNTNVLILGLVADNSAVGIYSAGEKLVKALQSIFTPLTQTLYPYISRVTVTEPGKSLRSIKILMKYMVILTSVLTAFVIYYSKPITHLLFGAEFVLTSKIVKITSGMLIIGMVNYILGILFMTNFGMKAQFSHAVVFTGIVNLFVCSALSKLMGAVGAAIAFTSAEVILSILLISFIFNHRQQWIQKIN